MGYLERAGEVSLPCGDDWRQAFLPAHFHSDYPLLDPARPMPAVGRALAATRSGCPRWWALVYFCGGGRAGGGSLPAAKPQPGAAGRHGLAGDQSLYDLGGGAICRRAAGVLHPRHRAPAGPRRRLGAVLTRSPAAGRPQCRAGRLDEERGALVSRRRAGRAGVVAWRRNGGRQMLRQAGACCWPEPPGTGSRDGCSNSPWPPTTTW